MSSQIYKYRDLASVNYREEFPLADEHRCVFLSVNIPRSLNRNCSFSKSKFYYRVCIFGIQCENFNFVFWSEILSLNKYLEVKICYTMYRKIQEINNLDMLQIFNINKKIKYLSMIKGIFNNDLILILQVNCLFFMGKNATWECDRALLQYTLYKQLTLLTTYKYLNWIMW